MPAFLRLSRADRAVAFQAALLLVAVALSAGVVGYPRTQRTASWLARPGGPSRVDPGRVAHLVAAAAATLPGSYSCFHRSLTTWVLLQRQGVDGALQFGVRRAETSAPLDFHSWVRVDGIAIGDDEANVSTYQRLDDPRWVGAKRQMDTHSGARDER